VSFAKFDETVDIAVRLGVDPIHADQMVRGTVVCPMYRKEVRGACFCKGWEGDGSLRAACGPMSAMTICWKNQIRWLNSTSRCHAGYDGAVGKIRKITGPRGWCQMQRQVPVTFDVARALMILKPKMIFAWKSRYCSCPHGESILRPWKLYQNIMAFMETICSIETGLQQRNLFKGIAISTTMVRVLGIDTSDIKKFIK